MSKFLVIDDEVGIREVIRDALKKDGHEVTTVPSAEQAYATILKEPFDLVCTDLQIGEESGIDVLKKIKELQKDMPVVIYSGAVTAAVEEEAKKAGVSAVLSKDIGVAELLKQLKSFIKTDAPAAGARAEKKILIIDDEAEIRNVLTAFFTKKGYKTKEAENGEKALAIVKDEDFSVVLCDIDMPVMDGLTTLQKMLELKPGICVVMVTGRQDDDKVKKALELGAYNYVLKPFEFLYLELVIKSKLTSGSNAPAKKE